MTTLQLKKVILYSLFGILTVMLLYPYWVVLVWAAILAIILYPVQRKLQRYTRVLTIVIIFSVLIITPILLLLFFELLAFSDYLSNPDNINNLMMGTNNVILNLPIVGYYIKINRVNMESLLKQAFKAENIQNFIPLIKYSGVLLFNFFVNLFLLFVFLYQFLRYENNIKKFFVNVVFKGLEMKEEFLETLLTTTRQISLNILLVGFSTGIIMGAIYYFLGLPLPGSLGILTGIVAIIPLFAPIFYGIVALLLIFNKAYFSAFLIFSIGMLIHFIADNIVQPKLLESQANLNFAASLLGILSGLEMLGPVGIFLGPIIFNLVLSLVKRSYHSEA